MTQGLLSANPSERSQRLLHSFQLSPEKDKEINEQRHHLLQANSLGSNVIIGTMLCHQRTSGPQLKARPVSISSRLLCILHLRAHSRLPRQPHRRRHQDVVSEVSADKPGLALFT